MYVVIAGITTLGRKLVEELEDNHDIVVIDEDQDRCERLYSSSGATVINKSPSNITALEDAGVTKADVLISALDDDNSNMVVCSLAKKYGVPKVVSRVENDEYLEAFEIVGAEPIAHTDILLSEFLSYVEHPYLLKLANLSNNREILKASIKEGSGLEGRTPKEMQQDDKFPDRFKVVSVLQDDKTISDDLNIQLNQEDKMIMIGPSDMTDKLDRYFQKQ
ncbi:MAG: TrkA family potassium uptake protein [Nanohaloarchaea archaeon]|nr:TrkA family potassium uptake protein [Candidatus Nanohaloarchaea archaeon]